MSSDIASKRST